jgi:hypothetical protein
MAPMLGRVVRGFNFYAYKLMSVSRKRLASLLSVAAAVFHYVANLEWTERVQRECIFCNKANFARIVYEVT